jgi:hypothetical protein
MQFPRERVFHVLSWSPVGGSLQMSVLDGGFLDGGFLGGAAQGRENGSGQRKSVESIENDGS